ncbi:hypothetical protein NVP1064O_27 [Vibrio phage 1.064.O._10N.261.52.E2]|nr:hypothetical protein NVP1064O_27 [Vibrio phage 1.064.O._10N.261.52.E2]AUR88093.1 hypothetical protein NVP1108O_27 [Vibrio phage 1.108.O._10N.222.51.A4]AUR88154.1 hypothetical protein NVP1110O_26 [Vibrio phage 1.110.O._10N.261.52.C1]AUR89698.1 hypothetical protein NVP1131O_29 [Vibrio phage 1.131.O._10N.222.49.A8]AUR91196.1 hypothetical protein NVP1157O_28 [Vibrio phage 1.157.O._10N.261.45.B7]AUR93065.1 hypothetical protein NVP1182O_23 [Vibrio phage 1.182.O._10N.286.46.E1]AUR96625.1 hypothet
MEKFTKGVWEARPNKRSPDDMQVWYPHGFLTSANVIPVSDERLKDESWYDFQVRIEPKRDAAREESNANMHLIASAPEMYEVLTTIESMLNGMVGEHHYDGNLHREIESLLAKARGESEAN